MLPFAPRHRLAACSRRTLGAALAVVLAGCSVSRAAPPPANAPGTTSPGGLHVLMVNGGGNREQNFASHLAHLRKLSTQLGATGVPRERITILSSDGSNPGADLAVRETEPESFWMLHGTRLGAALREPITFESSTVPGHALLPATRGSLEAYFAAARTRLRAGDTLILYVTDHGTEDKRDPLDTKIVLWGQAITVRQLRTLIERLDPGVRVVALMSQCFSGGFAGIMYAGARGQPPRGNVCGYFASTADRPAYGCYPESREGDEVGHSFEFFAALSRSGSFPAAHAEVLAGDQTPDVPLRTSDAFLGDLVSRAAKARGEKLDPFVDGLLEEAWKDRAAWEPELRLLDRIGTAFGTFSPRSLAELGAHGGSVPKLLDRLSAHEEAWGNALSDATNANLGRLLDADATWRRRLGPQPMRGLDGNARRALTVALLKDLAATADKDPTMRARLTALSERTAATGDASYRMEVRQAALLRMRTLLISIAGRVHLARAGTAAERASFEALRACEDLRLPPVPGAKPAEPAAPYPPFTEEIRLAEKVLPGYMGISFDQVPPSLRQRFALEAGAAYVQAVQPDSPAQAAGLAPGDIVIGPPGAPFTAPREIRAFTALLPIGKAQPLEVLRAGARRQVTLVPGAFPTEAIPLPEPPKPSDKAPPLVGSSYRGRAPSSLAGGTPHLLFFWATWCGPCKAALPDVLAFSRARGVPVVAITDEGKTALDPFFASWTRPFPETVVSDEARASFIAYAVSGTPTFVLVDEKGVVSAYQVGFDPRRGLRLPGWQAGAAAPR